MNKIKTIWKVLFFIAILSIGLLVLIQARTTFLTSVLQDPAIYFKTNQIEKISLKRKQFGSLSMELLEQDSFIESLPDTSEGEIVNAANRNWVILDKEKSIYGQYTEFYMTKAHLKTTPESIVGGVVQIWKNSFTLQEQQHHFLQKDNLTIYEGVLKEGNAEILVLSIFTKKQNIGKLLIIRTPYYEKKLFEKMKQSIQFN